MAQVIADTFEPHLQDSKPPRIPKKSNIIYGKKHEDGKKPLTI